MPLADKIVELRKKQGWSQIDLADRLDVSRQSVSKWEMAQAVPELDKIIKMSELFAVTTDYLLKDAAPGPEQTDAPPPPPPEETPPAAPEPEKDASPAPAKTRWKKWPWALAACLILVCGALAAKGSAARERQAPPQATPIPFTASTPIPLPVEQAATEEAVIEEPASLSLEQTAVSDPDAPGAGMTEFTYEGNAVTGGGIDPEALAAIAAEYAPFGLTCDTDSGQWYLDGEPIRVFTDVLTSNGESLASGNFQGTMRNFAGDGAIDVRTVRDFDHCDDKGCGTLLYVESCDILHEDARWVAHHPEDHHAEDHHE